MGQSAKPASTSLIKKCAAFLDARLGKQPKAVVNAVGPFVAAAYYQGACDTATELIESARDKGLEGVIDDASDIVKQCHGAAQSQQTS
jgi:hypothetical protein